MATRIERIVFTGDSFRSVGGEPNQRINVAWLRDRLGALLADLTRLPQDSRLPLVGAAVADMLALQDERAKPGLDAWARVFWQRATPRLVAAVAEACEGALIVTCEMPPVLEDAFDRAGVAWVDVGVSPLRFLPDLALHVKASAHFHWERARDYALSAAEIARYAAHVSGVCASVDLSGPTVVFFAQTLSDRTLIADGRFLGESDVIARLSSGGRPLLVKPHPWEPDNPVVAALVARGATVTHANTYALLSRPEVEVVTLSSSVGREARAFGRKTVILNPAVQDWAFSGVDLLRYARSPQFWGRLLASAGVAVSPTAAPEQSWRPNRLRDAIPRQGFDPAVWANFDDAAA